MPIRKTANQFRQVLGELLAKRQMTRDAFCRSIRLPPSTLSLLEIKAGTKLPKSLDLDRWSEALALTDHEKRKLRLAAELAWSPLGVQDLVVRLQKENEELKRSKRG